MEVHGLGAELFCAGGQTDRHDETMHLTTVTRAADTSVIIYRIVTYTSSEVRQKGDVVILYFS
jgi:hypothetical protein